MVVGKGETGDYLKKLKINIWLVNKLINYTFQKINIFFTYMLLNL